MQKLGFSPTGLRFLIVVLLLLGVFFRFVNIDRKVYWHDEVYTSMRISGYTGTEFVEQVFTGQIIGVEDLLKYQRLSPKKGLFDTLNALMASPEHSPLYYLIARFWVQLFGSSVAATRSSSACISLLVFPSLYWLCGELFGTPLLGWFAIAFMAISPFHVLYAQEAREYSLWTLTVLLSTASLLRAMRLHTRQSWGIYAATLALGFYSFLFNVFVALAHGIYVFSESVRFKARNFASLQTFLGYILATGVGLLMFAPWIWVLINNGSKLQTKTAWTTVKVPLLFLVKIWGLHLSCIWVDLGLDIEHPFTYIIPPILLILLGYCIYCLCLHSPKRVWLLLLTSIAVPAIALILPDLILWGRRSSMSRYFVPCLVSIQLVVAYILATHLTSASVLKQKIGAAIMAVLISLGVISCTISSQAESWWNKVVGYNNPQVARIINQAPLPLAIANSSDINPGLLISLSYLLDPKVRFQLVVDPNVPKIPEGFSNVFLINPSESLRLGIEKQYNSKTKLVYASGALWKLNQ